MSNQCVFCGAPAEAEANDVPVCAEHYNALAAPTCELCGNPISPEDLADGETVCLACVGGELVAEIRLDSPLLATVRRRLAGE